jgi:hypothetical protein
MGNRFLTAGRLQPEQEEAPKMAKSKKNTDDETGLVPTFCYPLNGGEGVVMDLAPGADAPEGFVFSPAEVPADAKPETAEDKLKAAVEVKDKLIKELEAQNADLKKEVGTLKGQLTKAKKSD